MNFKSSSSPSSIAHLNGECVTQWVGVEMALDGGTAVVTDETVVTGFAGESPVLWAHPDVPFWQFSGIYIGIGAGFHFHLFAEEAADGTYDLGLVQSDAMPAPVPEEHGAIYRTRVLEHLPTGVAKLTVLRQEPSGAVLDVLLEIGGDVIRLLAGEVYARQGGSFEITTPDESVLVQLNGVRPDLAC